MLVINTAAVSTVLGWMVHVPAGLAPPAGTAHRFPVISRLSVFLCSGCRYQLDGVSAIPTQKTFDKNRKSNEKEDFLYFR
jgi:hypothetical protein